MDSEHSEYSELYETYNEGRIKWEDIYGQESNNTDEKKGHSPNSKLDNPNLNIEAQQNIIQNSNGNGQAPNINSPLHSNNNNAQPLNNISFQVHNEENKIFSNGINKYCNDKDALPDKNKDGQSSDDQLLDKSKAQSPHNNNNQPIDFIAQNNNNNSNYQHQKELPIKNINQYINIRGKFKYLINI